MDTKKQNAILLHLKTGQVFKFVQCNKCLFYFDTGVLSTSDESKNFVINYTILHIVKETRNTSLKMKLKEQIMHGNIKKFYTFQALQHSKLMSAIT